MMNNERVPVVVKVFVEVVAKVVSKLIANSPKKRKFESKF